MKKKETKHIASIQGYKGFDKDFKCRDKQYEVGKDFTESDAVICEKGLHFCENPLDVLNYYPAADSKFASVTGSGKIDRKDGEKEDTKLSVTSLKIETEITLHKLIEFGVKFIFDRTTKTKEKTNTEKNKQCTNILDRGAASNSGERGAASNSGYRGAASNSGDSGAASNSGYSGAASNSGYSGAASNSGDSGAASNSGYSGAASNSGYRGAASNSGYRGAASNSGERGAASNSGDSGAAFTIANYSTASTNAEKSVAVGIGYLNKVKASLGSWIVVAERNDKHEILNIVSVKVDGITVKSDTFYSLVDNNLQES